jgi:UPF0176 protein
MDVATFYHFMPLADLAALRESLAVLCAAQSVKGILLIAPEGFNGTIAAEKEALQRAIEGIRTCTGAPEFEVKWSCFERLPFKRMKVRIKKEIVTLGVAGVDPSRRVGTYIAPQDWNALISEPDVLVIDTRNAYEVAIGGFAGAVDPGTRSFGQFPAFVRERFDPAKHKKIAMYCTGGIRCEKTSSFMLGEGFEEVYQLKGGILAYLETIPESESLWQGGCFVFDERVAVGHGLRPLPVRLCLACDTALDALALASEGYEEGVSCPACRDRLSPAQIASARERQRQFTLAAKRK